MYTKEVNEPNEQSEKLFSLSMRRGDFLHRPRQLINRHDESRLSGGHRKSLRGANKMTISNDGLKRLLKLVLDARTKEANRLDEEILQKLSIAFVERTIGKDYDQKEREPLSKEPVPKEHDFECIWSTKETAKKLHVTQSDLRALRNAKELKEGWHYMTGRWPRPTAIWYDLNQTCLQIHGITWTAFNNPGFDLKAHTERRTAQAFDAARRRQKT